MEDRRTPELWLEMSDLAPEAYEVRRVPALRAWRGVVRVSWWRNLRPGREEYPRSIPEFATLGVCEAGPGFEPPPLPEDIRGHHFVATPRPGQGALGRGPTLGLELVLVSPKSPGGAQALRDWADFVHIREIAAASVPGFAMITPYENASGGEPRYLHFYEMDTADAEEAFQRMTPATLKRIGAPGTEGFRAWAGHPELRIDYVNTFARVGATWDSGDGPG